MAKIENTVSINRKAVFVHSIYKKRQSLINHVVQAKQEKSQALSFETMSSPMQIRAQLPLTKLAAETVIRGQQTLKNILDRRDPRFIMVVGPCSIHDPIAGLEYAQRLAKLTDELSDTLCIVMRVYLEKPRTTIGWKGLINDPYLDGSCAVEMGVKTAREFLLQVNELGLPVATETLNPNFLQYLSDVVSWTAIGARTSESQIHREISSGFNIPVGFKNGTSGALDMAVNAIISASKSHAFLGIDDAGHSSVISTAGNPYGHIVLRGGGGRANYDSESITATEQILEKNKLPSNIIIDCSHDNSSKNYKLQTSVLSNIVQQIRDGNGSILGAMLESNLEAGNQPIPKDLSELKYGCSVTDGCIDWETTENILRQTREDLREVLLKRFFKRG